MKMGAPPLDGFRLGRISIIFLRLGGYGEGVNEGIDEFEWIVSADEERYRKWEQKFISKKPRMV